MVERFSKMRNHIRNLWSELYRVTEEIPEYSTLIPLPYPYIVPGGRFREGYYWDSYFTCLGLTKSSQAPKGLCSPSHGRVLMAGDSYPDRIEQMVGNFAHLIDRYGHIPNGNRVYYLSRSQPPFFCCMLQLLEKYKGFAAIAPYLPQLEAEYNYWMSGRVEFTRDRRDIGRVIDLEGSEVLNRYWDAENIPRPEAYREDVGTYQSASPECRGNIYRNIRAAAESGWDFSSRWLRGPKWDLPSIRTTEIVPVELNCLMCNMEQQLACWLDRFPRAADYQVAADRRRQAILKYCWNDAEGWFCDYSWVDRQQTEILSLAGVFPLFLQIAEQKQATKVAARIARDFLKAGGVVTTLQQSDQQWDAPNGWAPLQWVTVKGLLNYGYVELAGEIAERFVALADRVYEETGRMMEKYDVWDPNRLAGGGEYPTQDGFGWTNGVVEALLDRLEVLRSPRL